MTELVQTGRKGKSSGHVLNNIHCLMIPLQDEILLLPNAAVAEVIAYTSPGVLADTPEWFLGRISWRDQWVPVLSFEAASGKGNPAEANTQSRIAVLNTLNANVDVPYIGILTQGIPHLQLVQVDSIKNTPTPGTRQSIAEMAILNDEQVIIPDVDDLEQRLVRLHKL